MIWITLILDRRNTGLFCIVFFISEKYPKFPPYITITSELGRDLGRIGAWANKWKMSFNPDPSKQAVEIYFSRKARPTIAPVVTFNNTAVVNCESHKHLGLVLDKKLVFNHHLDEKIAKANKVIGLINKLRKFIPRDSLLTIYKSFVRPHLDYGDVIYDYPGNATFTQRLESIQYNACLAITGCFRGTSRDKLYSELGLESLADRRFCRRLCTFYKIYNGLAPQYLLKYIPFQHATRINMRSRPAIYPLDARTERYRNSFFPYCVSQWNGLESYKKSPFNCFF